MEQIDQMGTLKFIPLTVDQIEKISDRFYITLGGVNLIFEAAWNEEVMGLFMSCYDQESNSIIEGRPLILGENYFEGLTNQRLPANLRLVPLDLTGAADQIGITLDNLKSEAVKLYIFEG